MAGQSTSTSKLPKSIKWLGKRATLLVQYLGPGTYTAEYCYKKWPSKYVGYNTRMVVFRMAVTKDRVEEQLLAWVVENKLMPVGKPVRKRRNKGRKALDVDVQYHTLGI